jgi:hypothetical protein
LITVILLSFLFFSPDPLLDAGIRSDFKKVLKESSKAEAFIKKHENSQTQLAQAYKGAAKAMMAEHVLNPYSKYHLFKEGTKTIDKLITQQPKNIEIRFLRLMLQKESPSFLGYDDQILEDAKVFHQHYKSYEHCNLSYKLYMRDILTQMLADDARIQTLFKDLK